MIQQPNQKKLAIAESVERVFLLPAIIVAILFLFRLALDGIVIFWAFADALVRSLLGAIP